RVLHSFPTRRSSDLECGSRVKELGMITSQTDKRNIAVKELFAFRFIVVFPFDWLLCSFELIIFIVMNNTIWITHYRIIIPQFSKLPNHFGSRNGEEEGSVCSQL